jgi:hypothetical protein
MRGKEFLDKSIVASQEGLYFMVLVLNDEGDQKGFKIETENWPFIWLFDYQVSSITSMWLPYSLESIAFT